MKKRLLCILLALVMVVGLLPLTAVQAYAGTWDICFVCKEENVVFCNECFDCLNCEGREYCSECEVCDDCIVQDDFCRECANHIDCAENSVDFTDCGHFCEECADSIFVCSECNNCEWCVGIACEECKRCTDCVDYYSEDCFHCYDCFGLCELCLTCGECDGVLFCEDCGLCELCVDLCTSCYYLCSECISICESCDQCADCADEFCYECNLCSDCVEICPDCGEYCEDCTALCEDCGKCENCADDFCDNCSLCSDCVTVCEYCGDSCENCADKFCQECNHFGSCCSYICDNCNICDECYNVCYACEEVCELCATICPDCYYCEDCCICSSLPQFTIQPTDAEVVTDDGVAIICWRTNFSPKQQYLMIPGTNIVHTRLTNLTRDIELGVNQKGYFIRSYYDTGSYVDSNVFYVNKVAARIELDEDLVAMYNEAYVLPGETFTVNWSCNFEPIRQYVEKNGKFYVELAPDATRYAFPGTDLENYAIYAYYTDEKFISSDEFFVYNAEFNKQPDGGTVEEGKKHSINWGLSFVPSRQYLITYTPEGGLTKTGINSTVRTVNLPALPEGGYYQIRSHINADKYIESETFTVSVKKDTVTVLFYLDRNDEYATSWCEVETGKTATPPEDPAPEGKTFLGWYTAEGVKFDFNTPITADLKLYATFVDAYEDGWQKIDGDWYYYKNGAPTTGWQKVDGKWYYMDANGVMLTGWQKVDGKWYYLNNNMKTGWQQIGGKWYYLGTNGAMTTGWQKVSGKWYYMNANGVMQTGWQKISGKWYYLNSDMKTGWQKISGKWYYLNNEMKTGWQQIGGKWYYLGTDGAMQTGWIKLSGKWYYLNSSGVMVTGTQVIDGKTYTFNSSGVWVG